MPLLKLHHHHSLLLEGERGGGVMAMGRWPEELSQSQGAEE